MLSSSLDTPIKKEVKEKIIYMICIIFLCNRLSLHIFTNKEFMWIYEFDVCGYTEVT